jgi:hypothetical protein
MRCHHHCNAALHSIALLGFQPDDPNIDEHIIAYAQRWRKTNVEASVSPPTISRMHPPPILLSSLQSHYLLYLPSPLTLLIPLVLHTSLVHPLLFLLQLMAPANYILPLTLLTTTVGVNVKEGRSKRTEKYKALGKHSAGPPKFAGRSSSVLSVLTLLYACTRSFD